MALIKIFSLDRYKARIKELSEEHQNYFIRIYFRYLKQMNYVFSWMLTFIFVLFIFYTFNLELYPIVSVMIPLVVFLGALMLFINKSNLEALLRNLEEREVTPAYARKPGKKQRG
jgi:magnesium-transporting ATPase (P-type)